MFLFLVACGTSNQNEDGQSGQSDEHTRTSTMTGYIAEVNEEQVMVVEKKIYQPFSSIPIEEANEKAGNAINFHLESISSATNFHIGEKVEVTHGTVQESYPGQSTALDIKRVVDDTYDVIIQHDGIENAIQLELLLQAIQTEEDQQMRMVQYTVEGDPIFYTYSYKNDQINVLVDASEDQYGSKDNRITQFTCDQFEYYLKDQQTISFDLVGCDNGEDTTSFQVAEIKLSEIIIPFQQYSSVQISVGNNILLDTKDSKEISKVIDAIKKGDGQSIAAMTLMQPDGKLVLSGELADITFDFYPPGNFVRLNSYLETELSF